MRVLYLLDYPLGLPGGAQTSSLSMGELLRKAKKAEIFYCYPSNSKYISNISKSFVLEINSLKNHFIAPYKNPFEFCRIVNKIQSFIYHIQPHIIHSQMPISLIINALMKADYPVVKCHTDRSLYEYYRLPMRIINHWALKKIDMLFTTTNINAHNWQNKTNTRVKVIPNLVSNEFNSYNPEFKINLQKKHKIKDSLVIGFAGRMTEAKNWPLALEIVKKLDQNRKNFFVFLILGVNYDNYLEKKKAEELVATMKSILGNRLVYKENATQKEMSNFYYLVDIFLLTSKMESFGRTAIEAMARKCCVLGTNVGGIPEVIGDPDLICDQNSQCFIDRLIPLMDNRELLEEKKERLFMRYKKTFDPQVIISNQYTIYQELLNEKKQRGD